MQVLHSLIGDYATFTFNQYDCVVANNIDMLKI